MDRKKATKTKFIIPLALFFVLLSNACSDKRTDENNDKIVNSIETVIQNLTAATEIAVESPPFTEGIFPCSDCHSAIDPNPERRELIDFHDDISAIFDHDSENRWCLDCHDMNSRDSLKLASGNLLDFKESYKLCGQCHGEKLRDWKVGVHGKRTGYWNGQKEYLLCVHCHDPHTPQFKEITPEPPPVYQEILN